MNKKLLTAAIGAALAAGPMLAQADVKLYGKVHVSVDFVTPGDAGTTDTIGRKSTNVSSNASRWGIDISEKLGGGLSAIAKLEQQINADGETGSQDARNRYVGLKGKYGQIIAGNHDTPFKDAGRAVDFFPEYIGDNRNIMSTGANSGLGWDLRPPNSVRYDSPSMNGFVATYQYSADSTTSTTLEDNRRRVDSLGVKYGKGPLAVAYAYESHRFSTIADSGKPHESGQRLSASYNFGAIKIGGVYQNLTDLGGVSTGRSGVDRKSWMLGGAYTAGNNVFKVQYAKLGDINATSAGASGADTGAKMWAIGWDHLFSKTTKAYVAYAKTDNSISGNQPVNGPSGGAHSDNTIPNAGGDPSAWSIGMIVDF